LQAVAEHPARLVGGKRSGGRRLKSFEKGGSMACSLGAFTGLLKKKASLNRGDRNLKGDVAAIS